MVSNIGSGFPYNNINNTIPNNDIRNQTNNTQKRPIFNDIRANETKAKFNDFDNAESKPNETITIEISDFVADKDSDGRLKAQPRGSLLDFEI